MHARMLRGLSGWLGMSREGEEEKPPLLEGESSRSEAAGEGAPGPEELAVPSQEQVDPDPLVRQAKGLGSKCLPPLRPPPGREPR